jgi:hypothetical protein
MHPGQFGRPVGSYDPDEPLVIRHQDAIAARNAVGALLSVMRDADVTLDDYQVWRIGHGLALGIDRDVPRADPSTRHDSTT